MMSRLAPLALAASLLASTTGCYLNSAGQQLEGRVDTLEARQNEFMATFDADRAELADLLRRTEDNIAELEAALNAAQAFLQRNNADLGVRVDTLGEDVNELRGRMEEVLFEAQRMRDDLELFRQEIEIRINAMGR
jgi:septal ring factor EnvC (AmiA/AmiB activator)